MYKWNQLNLANLLHKTPIKLQFMFFRRHPKGFDIEIVDRCSLPQKRNQKKIYHFTASGVLSSILHHSKTFVKMS